MMFGFEIRCIHKSRLYSEWAVVSPGKRGLPRYRRTWCRDRDPDRGPIPGGMFGLWVEQVFGGLVPDGGWWLWRLWRLVGDRPTPTYRLRAEWA